MKHILAAAFLTAALATPAFAESGLSIPGDVNAQSQGPTDYYTNGYDRYFVPRAEYRAPVRLKMRHSRIIHRPAMRY